MTKSNLVIILVIGASGFAFPPLWILLLIYIVWIWRFKRPLRAGLIKKDIGDMLARGETLARIDINFNDARAYALENGGRMVDTDRAIMSLLVNDRPRKIAFSRSHRLPGTWVRFEDN